MRFSLGFTADAAAAHRHEFSQAKESDALPSMSRLSQSLGLQKPKESSTSLQPNTGTLTSQPSQTSIASSSDGEEEDEVAGRVDAPKKHTMPRQRPNRSKTEFQFAHPVTTRHRLKLRPKLLLQLHENNRSARAFPKYDVLPADMTTRLVCRLSKPLGNIRAFGSKDLVIVNSDMYEQQPTSDDRSISSDETCTEQREVVATICQSGSGDDTSRRCKVEIALSSGVCWEGSPLPNGSFELVSQGGNSASRKIRWVARDKKPGPGTSSTPSRFTFSVINPNSRKHPVIASMTRKGLVVFDQYCDPSQVDEEQSPPGSPSTVSTKSSSGRGLINTDEDLRQLIVMTGVWVAFVEGWSTKSLTNGDSTARRDSSATPQTRSRSSTYLSAEGVSAVEKSATDPVTNSSNGKKVVSRRSTHSDLWHQKITETNEDASSRPRRSKSLSTADHGERWTSVETDKAVEKSAKQNTGHETYEEDDKTKTRRWRRLSSIFGKKKK